MVKNLPANAGDTGLIPESGTSPGGRNGNSSVPGKSHGQRSLADYSPWSCEELNVTKHSTVHSKEQVRATSFATRDSHNVPSKKTE